MKKINSLTWGLFNIRPKYPFSFIKYNIKDFIIMLKRIPYVIRHGYYDSANWETYSYMIDMWTEILTWYRDHRNGSCIILNLPVHTEINEKFLEANEKAVDNKLDEMLAELAIMREDLLDSTDGYEAAIQRRDEAADKFFNNFRKIFFHLWD